MITNCRACASDDLALVLDLGEQRLSDFRTDDTRPPLYPLQLLMCRSCALAQLGDTVPRDLLYHDGYGFYSGVNEGIRRDLKSVVDLALGYKPTATNWLDIACNDGTLLSYVPDRLYRVGVDPVRKFIPDSSKHADLIIGDYFDPQLLALGAKPTLDARTLEEPVGLLDRRFDVISSVSVFYDLDDPGEFVEQVASVLHDHGIWIIQQNYLADVITNHAIDTVSHEHVTYWSLHSLCRLLEARGLRVASVSTSTINGGSFRTVVVPDRSWVPTDESVQRQLRREREISLGDVEIYRRWASECKQQIAALADLLQEIREQGWTCYIYAASTRGATIWQAVPIEPEHCPYAVERNPDKVGRQFSALGIPIISEEQAREDAPDYMLVGPWWFRDQIINRERSYLAHGGKLIFPLPVMDIVGRAGHSVPL